MRAIVYREPERFGVEHLPDRDLTAGEVRIKNLMVGVCGTDQHLHVGEFGPAYPLTPGHEIVGEVIEVADDVTDLHVGQRVAIDNTVFCDRCDNCRAGEQIFCQFGGHLGILAPGGFAERTIAAAAKAYPIGNMQLDAAALIEPTACVVHGLDVLNLKPGSDVLVTGAGPTSQILAQLLIHGGASRVTMAAPTQFKLDVAKSHGIDETVQVDRGDFTASAAQLRALAPNGFDVVVEATGAVSVLQNVLAHVKSRGTLMIYGMADQKALITVSPFEIFRREITIKGSFAQTYGFTRAIALLERGRVNPAGIVTHRFRLDQYSDALAALRDPNCLKAVMMPSI